MKKGDAVQLSIIIIALILAFMSLQLFFSGIIQLIYGVLSNHGEETYFVEMIAGIFLPPVLQLFICWLLLTRSGQLAGFIYEKSNIGTSFKIISNPQDLLFVLLVVTGFCFLLNNLAVLLRAIIVGFKSKATQNIFDSAGSFRSSDWTSIFINMLLPLILLMFAKPIAVYFAKNVNEEPAMFGEDIGHIDSAVTTTEE